MKVKLASEKYLHHEELVISYSPYICQNIFMLKL